MMSPIRHLQILVSFFICVFLSGLPVMWVSFRLVALDHCRPIFSLYIFYSAWKINAFNLLRVDLSALFIISSSCVAFASLNLVGFKMMWLIFNSGTWCRRPERQLFTIKVSLIDSFRFWPRSMGHWQWDTFWIAHVLSLSFTAQGYRVNLLINF